MKRYTDEKNVQVILALLKEHGIRKVIASPGTTNMALVASMQSDPYFEMYSSVDERSAAYLACGLAAESGEPVVISCTGATASRNYMPGLTEAFYRKLPILAITSTQSVSRIGHHVAQVIDRTSIPNDVAKLSVTLPIVKDDDDLWECEIKVNSAILELKRHGGGPAHINLPTKYSKTYDVDQLPKVRVINRITTSTEYPNLPQGKVAVFVGAHAIMSKDQIEVLDSFCSSNNAVVFCDHTSNYKGRYRVLNALAACQQVCDHTIICPDLLIHIGEVSGDYYSMAIKPKQIWRVSEDGEIRDTFKKLRYVFEMTEKCFFDHYTQRNNHDSVEYLNLCLNNLSELNKKIPEFSFSNIWIASKIAHRIPEGSIIHFGILNSLRSWNFFEIPATVFSTSNVGGFGIDGGLSTLIGASFSNKNKLFFGVIGDLAFFYDMNVLGNRHVGNNLRILVVNNGVGTEFRQFNHFASHFGEDANEFIAAAGHFGNKSPKLIKHYAQDLGFEYISASNKIEFEEVYEQFLISDIRERPMLFEVFTNDIDESEALKKIMNIEDNGKMKQFVKQAIVDNSIKVLRKFVK